MLIENDLCPQFKTLDESDNIFDIDKLTSKYLVIYFYPKDSTPGCTLESRAFSDKYQQFKDLDTEIVGISKDSKQSHVKFKDKQQLKHRLLVDDDASICNHFNVIKEKSMFGKKYMGIVRTTFIIGQNRQIIKAWHNVSVTGHVAAVLSFLKTLA